MKTFALVFALLGVAVAQDCSLPFQFQCNNGNCIPEQYVCDRDEDCEDGSDEPPILDADTYCPVCTPAQFKCDLGYCIPSSYLCDMKNDCLDRSDEISCPTCESGRFQCEIGGCIPEGFICDGENDCYDWSDEEEKICPPCNVDEIRCSPPGGPGTVPAGACIPADWVCDADGIWDCPDGFDEQGCDATQLLKRPRARPAIFKDDFSKIVYRDRLRAKHASKKQ